VAKILQTESVAFVLHPHRGVLRATDFIAMTFSRWHFKISEAKTIEIFEIESKPAEK